MNFNKLIGAGPSIITSIIVLLLLAPVACKSSSTASGTGAPNNSNSSPTLPATGMTTTTTTSTYTNDNKPFGLHNPYTIESTTAFNKAYVDSALGDLAVQYIRIDAADLPVVVNRVTGLGVKLIAIIAPITTSELQTLVSTYKGKVEYWEIENEPDTAYQANPAEYAVRLRSQYETIKSVDPSAVVLLGGLAQGTGVTPGSSGPNFLSTLLAAGAGPYFDIFNFHSQGQENDYTELANAVTVYTNVLASYGYPKPIWVTECATYDGSPVFSSASATATWPLQSETQQAAGLVKRYVFGASIGIDKMFWNMLVERHNFGGVVNSYFDNVGLVNNPANDGISSKKLNYFAFKKMIALLGGSDWKSIATIQNSSNGVHVIEVLNQGKSIYVAWWDQFAGTAMNYTISGVTGTSAVVTESVPAAASGAAVIDYNTAFNQYQAAITAGSLSVNLGEVPLYIAVQ